MKTYSVIKKNKEIKLKQVQTRSLYLDEIIDVKFIHEEQNRTPKYALMCSNNESLKVLNINNGTTELV